MSHFTVLVIGPDHEKQLQPFHEFECTGTNDEFVQNIDRTDEIRESIEGEETLEAIRSALDDYGLGDKIVEDESDANIEGQDCLHKYGYAVVKDGKLIKAIDRTNPNKKWDWWQVGGRWSGMYKLKAGASGALGRRSFLDKGPDERAGHADIMRKGDIDFEAMRNKAGQEAAAAWDKASAAAAGETWESWESVRDRLKPNYDAAREVYHGQPALARVKTAFDNPWDSVDEYLIPREAYIARQRDRAITTFAVLKDGQWFERGEMGWWACVTGDIGQDAWNRKFNELVDDLPDDTVLTLVDCHI